MLEVKYFLTDYLKPIDEPLLGPWNKENPDNATTNYM